MAHEGHLKLPTTSSAGVAFPSAGYGAVGSRVAMFTVSLPSSLYSSPFSSVPSSALSTSLFLLTIPLSLFPFFQFFPLLSLSYPLLTPTNPLPQPISPLSPLSPPLPSPSPLPPYRSHSLPTLLPPATHQSTTDWFHMLPAGHHDLVVLQITCHCHDQPTLPGTREWFVLQNIKPSQPTTTFKQP